jgi:phage major head subunit gpT-like protein
MKMLKLSALITGSLLVLLGALGLAIAEPTSLLSPADMPEILLAGLVVNAATLSSLFNGLKTLFNKALMAKPGGWQATAMEVPSSGPGEDYAWLERFPRFRKWIGDKVVKNIVAGKYYKANEDWETTVAVRRNDIEDDRIGLYNPQALGAGEAAAELNDIIVDDLKNNAFTQLCFDGQYFYDTDHPVAGASVSNKQTKALSANTNAAALASYGVARIAIMGFKDEEGQSLRLMPDTLEVGPALEATARLLCESPKLADDTPNPWQGTAKVLVNPAITSGTQWMLHVANKMSVKPFIVQMRAKPSFVQQTDSQADDVFNRAEFKFGAEARATGLYGFWQLSHGSTGTT